MEERRSRDLATMPRSTANPSAVAVAAAAVAELSSDRAVERASGAGGREAGGGGNLEGRGG